MAIDNFLVKIGLRAKPSSSAGKEVVDDAGKEVVDDAGKEVVDDAGKEVVDDAGKEVVDDAGKEPLGFKSEATRFFMVWAAIVPFLVLIGFLIWIYYAGFFKPNALGSANNIVVLPILGILSIAMLVSLLTMLTGILHYFGLDSKEEAFGLPAGSVRGFIALSLLVIFAVVAIYLYGSLGGTPSLASQILANQNLAKELLSNQTIANLLTSNQTSTIPASQNQVSFANQVLTVVGTLLTTIVGFYFGAKTAQSAKAPVAGGAKAPVAGGAKAPVAGGAKAPVATLDATIGLLVINPSDSYELAKGKKDLIITAETYPNGEAILWGIDGDPDGSLVQVSPNKFKYTPSKDLKTADLTFTLAKFKVSKSLKVTIKEKAKPNN